MPTTIDTPAIRPQTFTVPTRLDDGRTVNHSVTGIKGVPGGPAGEDFIVLVKPVPGRTEGLMFVHVERDKEYLRSWTKETQFVGSPNFPDGIPVGFVHQWTDTGTGQPYIERSAPQVTPDTLERLRAYAYGETYLSMPERRRLARESEKYQQQANAGRAITPGTKTPDEALRELADSRLMTQIDQIVEQRLAEKLAAKRPEGKS